METPPANHLPNQPGLRLKVAEAVQDDVNRGLVRIDSVLLKKLGLNSGDIVEIEGGRKTVGIVDRSYPGDINLGIVRMDPNIRRNAKTSLGDIVTIRKTAVAEAKKVIIAPARKDFMIKAPPEMFKHGLLGKAFVKGDVVSITSLRRRQSLGQNPFFDDMVSALSDSQIGFGIGTFGDLKFIVTNVQPVKVPVVVTEETVVEYNPEAEIEKEVSVPEISYEDIGGLEDEIKKIREMVELPLKHPEIFGRLGIEAPKGVLLHGPPGTGKTLLAKAVANETNSNFILINGPEIMCVSGDTPILTNPRGYLKAEEIYNEKGTNEKSNSYNLKKLEKPISTYSFKEGKIEKANITHVTKLIAESYKLKLNDGNELIVSENQPFLAYRNGDLVWEAVKNIHKGDYIARLNKLNLKEESYHIPLDELNKKFNLIEKEGKFAIKSRNLSRSNFIKLPEKTSADLLELVGLVVSDGNISNRSDSIGFYNKDIDLINRFKHLIKEVFAIDNLKEKNEKNCLGAIVYSKLLVEYLKVLGFTNENKENIPPYFFNLPLPEVKSFVRGYFDGDGGVLKLKIKGMVYPTPVIYSVKKDFLMPLQSLLLLKLGISSRLKEHNTLKGLMHKLVVRGNEGRVKFLEIGAVSKHKLESLKEIKKVVRIKEHENIPHPSLLISAIKRLPYKNYRNKDYYIYKTGNATKHSLQVLYDLASKNNLINESIKKEFEVLLREDISWEKVENISSEGKRELYDFTVDKDSFTAAPYFLMHNSKFYGESEANLRKKFEEGEKNAPSIIFIDEIDAIASKREETRGEVERRVVAQLLSVMDGLKSRGRVVVIAATNRPNSLDPALRRPGRFDREIEIGVPGKEGRLNILKIHTRGMPLAKNVNLPEIAGITHGFVGADLQSLAKEAAMIVLRRLLPDFNLDEEEPIPKEILEKLYVAQKDFKDALKIVRPSAMREVLVETPNVTWEDVGGLEEVKQKLVEAVEWPLKQPQVFERMGIRPPRGILLYGAPGTGKTMLAKAVAKESEANFILVNGPGLLSMWVGESERALREIFKKARQAAPTIIFFDEIDALAPRRGLGDSSRTGERMVNQLLTEMDGLEELNDVVVIAATNRPDILDSALLRPGRFDRIVYIPVPDEKGREKILNIHIKGMPLEKDINIKELAKKTQGYAGADLEAVCREAAMIALREDIKNKTVSNAHFQKALEVVRPSVSKEVEEAYKKLEKFFLTRKSKEIVKEAKREKEERPNYMG